jgi:general secretion pathway protein M
MRRSLTVRERRVGAWLLVALLLAVFHGLVVEPLVLGPLRQVETQMADVREQHQRFERLLAQRDRLQQTMRATPTVEALQGMLLEGDDPSAVAAELMQSVAQKVAANASRGAGCELTQRMPIIAADQAAEPFRAVRLSLDLNCAIEPLAALLHQLETSQPWLFVDELNIRRVGNAPIDGGAGRLSVHMLVSGFLGRSAAASDAQESVQ